MDEITIEAARVNTSMTQSDAAKALGISKSTLLSYEKYRTSPDISTALRIAELYGRPVDSIRWAE